MKSAVALWFVLLSCGLVTPAFAENRGFADAIENRDSVAIDEFLRSNNGEQLKKPQPDGTTALHWAVQHSDVELVVKLLEMGFDPNATNDFKATPLGLACVNGEPSIVAALLKAGSDAKGKWLDDELVLMTAARTGRAEIIKMLVEAGADVNRESRDEQSALMWAAADGHLEAVQTLVELGADVDARDETGWSAFLFAVREGKGTVCEYFIGRGVSPMETIDGGGGGRAPRDKTPAIEIAVENGHLDLAIRLVELGADPNDSRGGFAALHRLTWVRKPNRGDDLAGLPPPIGSGNLNTLQFARRLVELGADVNLRLSKQGQGNKARNSMNQATPFFMAADTADLAYMKLLVELGADPLIPNSSGTTPLMVAAGVGTNAPAEEAGDETESIAAVEYLLQLGADINGVDNNGDTTMHGAAYKNFPAMVEYLDERGASIDIWNRPNKLKLTPLKIAEGFRPGNFRPSPVTIAAIHRVMIKHGLTPPPPTDRDKEEKKIGYEDPGQ